MAPLAIFLAENDPRLRLCHGTPDADPFMFERVII
jgi:hypothetical protein